MAERQSWITLRCTCCNLPWARIENGVLVVRSRHHGEPHENFIALEELSRLWREHIDQENPPDGGPEHPADRAPSV